ncbi:Wzy polymerase domain-containing protein [Agarivorans aestuarii]|uniref:Wzy polymerase domain-containing protein n=1 Tax=Agarivorans aestuarii TaxID=1563703 RepID=A0ABU7G7X3_9ALTE|nr:Wzy polymerase domain-containing protein [Agarivorans aestuarii]MEE1675380.1 Wzy polymerase domain-containing protein [Agarivorans aestuarii]
MLYKASLERTFVNVFGAMMLLGMHYFQHNQGGTGLALPFNLVIWCFASILIGLGLIKVSQSQTLRYNKTLIGLAICIIGLWIPLLYPNAEFGTFALDRLIGLVAGLLLIFSLLQLNLSNKQWQQMLYMVVAAVLIESLYALTQMYLLTEDNWVGFNVNSIRATGIFQQPNVLGTFVLFGPLASIYLITTNSANKNISQFFIFLSCTLATWALVLSDSKTAIWSLLAILLLSAPYLKSNSRKQQFYLFYISIVLGLLIPTILSFNEPETLRSSLLGPSANVRITMLKVSLAMFQQSPILGVGYGAFDSNYMLTQSHLNEAGGLSNLMFNVAHPHNELALWGAEGGILALIFLVCAGVLVLTKCLQRNWREGLFYTSIIFPCAFHCLTELPFYHSAILWLLFCTFSARMIVNDEVAAKTLPAKFAPKIFGILIPSFTFIFMLTGLQANQRITQFERSGSVNASLLEEVTNPMPLQTRYEFNVMSFRLKAALSLGLKEELEYYLAWSEKLLRRQARTEHYYNRSVALRALGLTEQALANDQLANNIYPNTERLSYKLVSATNGGKESLKEYLVWNRTKIESRSNPQLYIHQINALVRLGEIKTAVDTLKEAENNFPEQINLNSVPSLKPYIKIKNNT